MSYSAFYLCVYVIGGLAVAFTLYILRCIYIGFRLEESDCFHNVRTNVRITRLPWWKRVCCNHRHATPYTVREFGLTVSAVECRGMVCIKCGTIITREVV